MQAQPLIAVHNVEESSHWYQTLLGCKSGHGGPDYGQIMYEGRMVLQLHHWDAHNHPHLGTENSKPYGNGVLLWFQTAEFDRVLARTNVLKAKIIEGPKVNPRTSHREVWLRDPDGYVVVIAGAYGDLGELPPPA